MASITLRRAEKHYGAQQGLFACSLDIKDDEFLVLAGPSGSGKTTILRIGAGLETVTKGEVYSVYAYMPAFDNMAGDAFL